MAWEGGGKREGKESWLLANSVLMALVQRKNIIFKQPLDGVSVTSKWLSSVKKLPFGRAI